MPRGVKKGENRFKAMQEAKVEYRKRRLLEVVIPQIKAMAPHVKVSSVNKYAKLVCEIYNSDLPVSEQKLGLRTVTQNPTYWKALGTVYYQLFDVKHELALFKDSVLQGEMKHKIDELTENNQRLLTENKALKSALRSTSIATQNDNAVVQNNEALVGQEYLCKLIDKLIQASDGVIKVDIVKGSIHDLSDDFSNKEGILPKEIVAPYIDYLNNLETG